MRREDHTMTDDPTDLATEACRCSCASATLSGGADETGLDAEILARICDAVLSPDRYWSDAGLSSLVTRGVPPRALMDLYIPAVARSFGESWLADGHSFAEVTIAVARLQGWLRELVPAEDPLAPVRLDVPEVLVVVPEGSHHTLGAMVATAQFRRLGAAVQVSLGQDVETIGARVRQHRFDLVALSAGGSEKLEFLRTVINILRTGLAPAPWVVIGGPILSEVHDVGVRVGADAATSDPEEALALCGPTISANGASLRNSKGLVQRAPPDRMVSVP